jgi:excisionase family DNA binding protein
MQITHDNLPQAVSGLYDKLEALEKLIKNNAGSPLPESDEIFNVKQTANFLDLAVATIYTDVHKRNIPHFRTGGRLYFSKQELTEWIKSGRRRTTSEIALEANRHTKSTK